MNELERLIAALPRPEPSAQLDDRVNEVLSQHRPTRPNTRWRNTLAWCSTAACIGLIGFVCGRWSISASPDAMVPTPMNLARPDSISHTVLKIPLREEQLGRMFVQNAEPEGMFGNKPLQIEVLSSP
jgi:hypothetical protein